jgi:DNA processing protein
LTLHASPSAPLSDDELGAWLQLLHSEGVGRDTARRLLAFFGSPQAVLDADSASLNGLVDAEMAARLGTPPEGHALRVANTLAWRSAAADRRVMVLGDADYPPLLLHSADPPLLLYLLGRAALLSAASVAIVGSRLASAQGLDNAHNFGRSLAQHGWTIVSGLAAGIDAAAHEGALDAGAAGASTIAVIGTGIDRVYPPGNRALAKRIAAQGLVVSELAVGTPPLGQNFPQRNRLIAGLSRGTLVVEAALRSGSLITARLAAEAGREVMALPGSLLAPQSQGCHALIRQGAALVVSPEQVLDELNGLPALSLLNALSEAAAAAGPAEGDAAAPSAGSSGQIDDAVLRALGHDPMSLDGLINRCGWPAGALSAYLMTLELDGKVARLPGGLYQRRQLG